jgi:hypothetical protein
MLLTRVSKPHQFNADPKQDPAFHLNADPDPDPAFHLNADPDPDPALQSDGPFSASKPPL